MFPSNVTDPSWKASDRAYSILRQMIVSLKLQPGTFIDEKSISAQLDIGRTPVREALLRLADQRLVSILPRKGTMVAPLRLQDVRAVEDLRWHLESLSTRWATERITPDELRAMQQLIIDAEAGAFTDIPDWDVEVDRSFHQMLAAAAKNEFLAETLTRLYDHSVRLLYATRSAMTPATDELPHYRAMLDGIAKGDPDLTERAMQDHLLASREQIANGFGSSFTHQPSGALS